MTEKINDKNITITLTPSDICNFVADIRKLQKYAEKFDDCIFPYQSNVKIANNLIDKVFPTELYIGEE